MTIDIGDELEPGVWMASVAEVLPPPFRDEMPFTLAEAVAELAVWARDARSESWASKQNRESLDLDIQELFRLIGPRLRSKLVALVPSLNTTHTRPSIESAADHFSSVWRDPGSISAAFRDLCEAATLPGATSSVLRPKAEILASQLRQPARGFGVLSDTARALAGEPHQFEIEAWFGKGQSPAHLTETERLQTAERMLMAGIPKGEVAVWIVYERALVDWRVTVGPITFLRADVAVPDALGEAIQDFPEREELRLVLDRALMWRDLDKDALDGDNRLVLARVDLGYRELPGAVRDARRTVEAVLSIAVGAGGVSWQDTGSTATVVDGQPAGSSRGRGGRRIMNFDDTYGMGATSQIVSEAAETLNSAMAERPMPDQLIEALLALREAGMTDHRDVSFYGARAVTPRIATALEDHALELLASVASLKPADLASALEEFEIEWKFEQEMLRGITAPFDNRIPKIDSHEEFERLERLICKYDNVGTRLVSVRTANELRGEVMSLPIGALAKTDFETAIAIVSDPKIESSVRNELRRSIGVMRARQRRVRNAINHGNPVGEAALSSVRAYSVRTSREALNIALNAYSVGRPMKDMMDDRKTVRIRTELEILSGRSYLDRLPQSTA